MIARRIAATGRAIGAFMVEESRAHPWMVPGLALTCSAWLGGHLPAIVAVVRGWLS